MSKMKITDSILPSIKFSIVESSSVVDGEHILAHIKGEFFVPDGISRNKRYYPSSLWEKVINNQNVKQKLKDRLMFGTVGHDGELGEKGIREGLISHIMTSIMIENGKGMGEALILNTPTGRILNTMLRAGCNLRVSSRANGTFKGTHQSMPVVDENDYDLEGWDFVIEAGFLEANPQLAESLAKDLQKAKNNETLLITDKRIGETMSEKSIETTLVQHVVDENAELKVRISKMTEELDAVKADKEAGDKKIADMESDDQEVAEKLKKLAKYEEMGEPEEIEADKKKADESEAELEKFKELGDSPEEVGESLKIAKTHLKYISENFGTVPSIKKALSEAIAFRAEVDSIGSVTEIKESLNSYKKIVEDAEAAKKDAETSDLAKELDMDKEVVAEMLTKHTPEELRTISAKIAENLAKKLPESTSRFAKKDTQVIVEGTDNKDPKTENAVNEDSYKHSSRADRINERFR